MSAKEQMPVKAQANTPDKAIAESVRRQAATPAPFAAVQRKCACGGTSASGSECAECKKKSAKVRRRALEQDSTAGAASPAHEACSRNVRAEAAAEPPFAHTFGDVRIHADGPAAAPAFVSRQANSSSGGGQSTSDDDGGYVQGPAEQSARIPKWVAALASSQQGSKPQQDSGPQADAKQQDSKSQQDPASVSAKSNAESVQSGSPEREAAAETPYKTDMSTDELSSSLRGGSQLDGDVRASFESRYSRSLDHVRVHNDPQSAALCDRFGARAFAFQNHIAFGRNLYQPRTAEGNLLLRHEVAHVMQDGSRGGVFRAAKCSTTCDPGTAPAFVPVSDTSFNCYAYALNSPGSGFLQPGQKSGTQEFTDLSSPDIAKRNAAAATYFTPAGMRRNMTADLGAPLSSNCTSCCASSKRKVVAVTTDALSSVGATHWDFHWYRKDADRAWSHKRGESDAQRDDAAGTDPICNPCSASRGYSGLDYKNVVASWCL